ncbi:hypothetical protein KFE25_010656 [Diacronema lutheri]|uniref:Uncharacterized protein n=1 Tax=Diacronema lutheri TaxID=2081491 RepID=A0A8J5XDT5_DIALT|nr:hypothetical protein KFE25_010656 [Diacronema lutheri]
MSGEQQLRTLSQRRSELVRHGVEDAAEAVELCTRCDALAEATCGRASAEYAHSLHWSAKLYARLAHDKGGGRAAKKETMQAIELFRESAALLTQTLGPHHLDSARGRFALAAALAGSGSKPHAREAQDVHADALAAFWRAHARPDLGELSISQMATALADIHLRARAHADGATEARAVGALVRDALAFEEAGAAGMGGPLTPAAHALRSVLARVLEAAGELPAAIAAAQAAREAIARGISDPPSARPPLAAVAAIAAPRTSRAKMSPEEATAMQAAVEEAQAAAAAEAGRLAVETAVSHAACCVEHARLLRAAGRREEAIYAERAALELLSVRVERMDRKSSVLAQAVLKTAARHNERRGSGDDADAAAARGAAAAAAATDAGAPSRRMSFARPRSEGSHDASRRSSRAPLLDALVPPTHSAAADRLWLDGSLAVDGAVRIAHDCVQLVLDGARGPAPTGDARGRHLAPPAVAAIEAAHEAIDEALQLARHVVGRESVEAAQALEMSAMLHEAERRSSAAADAWREAGRILVQAVGEEDARYQRCMAEQARFLTAWTAQAI